MSRTNNNLRSQINQKQKLKTRSTGLSNKLNLQTNSAFSIISPQIEKITKTTLKEKFEEKNIRPRKRSRKQRSKKKIKITIGNQSERNWECEKKTELEKQIFELTLKNLREKYKDKFSKDEYIKKLEEELCKLSVENIIQSTKVDVLNEERKQTQNLLFQINQKNSKSKKKIKQLVIQNKKLKKQLNNFQNNKNKIKKEKEKETGKKKENEIEKEKVKEKNNENININHDKSEQENKLLKETFYNDEKERYRRNKNENYYDNGNDNDNEDDNYNEQQNFDLISNLFDLGDLEMQNENLFGYVEKNFQDFENETFPLNELKMENEFENLLNLTEEYNFDEQDLSLLSSMTSPNFESQIQLFNKIYKSNRDQMKFSKINPEYQKVEKDKIIQFLNYLKKLKKLNSGRENNKSRDKNITWTDIAKDIRNMNFKNEKGEEKEKIHQSNQKGLKKENQTIPNNDVDEKRENGLNQEYKNINELDDEKIKGYEGINDNIYASDSDDDLKMVKDKQNIGINDFYEWEKQQKINFEIQMEEIITQKINLLK
ncbi:hypothetical protein M0813_25933 [Anaeramoeba flamelloides]|uniref:Uncharacterized protein n=1 Tax=Anaeramoeba flamelloides TaxID=1746091 RepID=A0ABQ8Y1M2_9EUKA|nr:hypothetical protein M0813_25933 [Anaeramoeba flamelloides]